MCWPQGHTEYVMSVAYSPDGEQLASGSKDKTVRVWQLATGKCTATLQVCAICGCKTTCKARQVYRNIMGKLSHIGCRDFRMAGSC